MPRDLIFMHIAEAERHIANGQHLIQQHRAFIARLGEIGSSTVNAEFLLESVQTAHERFLAFLRSLVPK